MLRAFLLVAALAWASGATAQLRPALGVDAGYDIESEGATFALHLAFLSQGDGGRFARGPVQYGVNVAAWLGPVARKPPCGRDEPDPTGECPPPPARELEQRLGRTLFLGLGPAFALRLADAVALEGHGLVGYGLVFAADGDVEADEIASAESAGGLAFGWGSLLRVDASPGLSLFGGYRGATIDAGEVEFEDVQGAAYGADPGEVVSHSLVVGARIGF